MGKRSKFSKFPATVQREIEDRLVANGFSDYEAIAKELSDRGYTIGKSAMHRTGKNIETRVMELRHLRLAREGLEEPRKVTVASNAAAHLTSIGARLKFERKQRGLGQKEMASAIGIPLNTYQTYELNRRTPGGGMLRKFAHMGLDIAWLLNGGALRQGSL